VEVAGNPATFLVDYGEPRVKVIVGMMCLVGLMGCSQSGHGQVTSELVRGAHVPSEREKSTTPSFRSAAKVRHPEIVSLGGRADGACLTSLRTLENELKVIVFPDDWTIAVTCNSLTWEAARQRAGNPPTQTAFTGLKPKVTVINAAVFREFASVYRRTLAHELGHIRCGCTSEGRAEDEAQLVLDKLPEEVVAQRQKEGAVTDALAK
jgi:hypothetical protein